MTWTDLHSEVASMFDGYSWRADDMQRAIETRAAMQRAKNREYAADSRARLKTSPARKRHRREYMREYMREYDQRRRVEDPAYLEKRRKHAREAMRRVYARKRGELIELRKTGGSLPGTPHREHRCRVCNEAGHNARRHAA